MSISANLYYKTYHGHNKDHLHIVYNTLKYNNPNSRFIFLAGDSSLDNKFWVQGYYNAVNGYEKVLEPAIMKPDVCYFMNKKADNCITINCAVEESTIKERENNLLDQDKFIRDNISKQDILVVSVGGNDIALKPTWKTIYNMIILMGLNSQWKISRGPNYAWGMKYFINMFKYELKNYILNLISKTKPSKIIICAIYYPDEKVTGSWADKILGYLGYNSNPEKLQEAIKQIYNRAISNIKIDGVQIVPFPLFMILDGKDTNDYVQRVEPSEIGGSKMAKYLLNECSK